MYMHPTTLLYDKTVVYPSLGKKWRVQAMATEQVQGIVSAFFRHLLDPGRQWPSSDVISTYAKISNTSYLVLSLVDLLFHKFI